MLISYLDGSTSIDDAFLNENNARIKLIDKIILNNDIINQKYKSFLISSLKGETIPEEELLTDVETEELIKQITISKNILGTTLGKNEMKELTDEIFDQLIEEFNVLGQNSIEEKIEKDRTYYEINNEIILDPEDRAIYMNLARLIGYLKQVKNIEIIFHYKNRRLNAEFL